MAAVGTKPRRPGGAVPPPGPPSSPSRGAKPRLKKLRILFVLLGLSFLALVSTVFGMMMAVSQDLPAIYNFAQYKAAKNSEVFDATGTPIGTLTSNQNKILLNSGQISPNIKNAVVSIEDARFYEHDGVDFRGIGRALMKDILSQSAAQGASTITEQFVKNALAAQESRTLFQKFFQEDRALAMKRMGWGLGLGRCRSALLVGRWSALVSPVARRPAARTSRRRETWGSRSIA